MDNEKSSAEKTSNFPQAPGMFVIKGRQEEIIQLPIQNVYVHLRKFTDFKSKSSFSLRLPLDNISKRILKRTADIFLSTVVIVGVLSWLIPIMGLLIKLDSRGPVFFLQKRNKKDGKIFTCIKFRSMVENEDADSLPAAAYDERITKLGRFLRRSFLDELPQFFNVWIGDMSIIGPRPHMVSDNNRYAELIEFYDYRHKVKPGITGLSQVMGYVGETKYLQAMKDRIQLDIFYVRHWSPKLDLKILWHTIIKITDI